jgi:hypothetical protein
MNVGCTNLLKIHNLRHISYPFLQYIYFCKSQQYYVGLLLQTTPRPHFSASKQAMSDPERN